MKTTLSRWLWLACLLVLLAGMFPAQAFYNPTTGRWLSRDPIGEEGGINVHCFAVNSSVNFFDVLGRESCKIKLRCNPIKRPRGSRLQVVVGWHCAVIAPTGVRYEIGGFESSADVGENAVPPKYPDPADQTPEVATKKEDEVDYPVSCPACSCEKVQACIKAYHATQTPPPYRRLGPNSNTYAHAMLTKCGCSVDPFKHYGATTYTPGPLGATMSYTVSTTTIPIGAVGW